MTLVVIGVMVFSAIMIAATGDNLNIWIGLISAGLGVFIPSPKYKNATGKVSNASPRPGPISPIPLRRSAPARVSI